VSAVRLLADPVDDLPQKQARLIRLLRGPADQPAWVRPAFLAIVALAAFLNIFNLTVSGYANTYYSAAVLAATRSWKAFLFGSVDAGNFITVDKPAGALWLMDLSARLFGVSSWSILLPEALAGAASVGLLFLVVRRSFGAAAGLVAALVMAVTPVAVLMFRYNNPDAVLTLLLIAAAWAFLRGLDTKRTRWFLLSALFVGLGFNTKYMQAYLVLPALVLTFALAAQGSWRRRIGQLLSSLAVLIVSSGWWMVIVDLIPKNSRPFIGGSSDNSVLNLVLGYDGFGRIFGAVGSGLGRFAGLAGGFGGTPGLLRMFNSVVGGQISWLVPLALISLAVGLFLHRGGPRTDRQLTGYVFWGIWLLVTIAVFSFSSGIFHPYYTVQLAPAISALVGAGIVELWRWRAGSWVAGFVLALGIVATAWWSAQLLGRTPTFIPWLGPALLGVAVGAAVMLILAAVAAPWMRALAMAAIGAGLIAILAGPTAYSIATVGQAYSGGDPSAGPASARTEGFVGGLRGSDGGNFEPPGGGPFGRNGAGSADNPNGQLPAFPGNGDGAPAGGLSPGAEVDSALIKFLESHQGGATWIVAVNGANEAGAIELASGKPVMAMGGFSGSDPAPTLDQLKTLVREGKLRYIIIGGSGMGGPGGNNSEAQAIRSWVLANGKQVNYGGTTSGSTLYDLSGAVS
jgi:4-amino-4-deoxy-L-arabinose transferase-like glycosyltransferase